MISFEELSILASVKLYRFLNIKQRPFELFGFAAVVCFIAAFIPFENSLDINLHDTYFVIAARNFCFLGTIVFLFIWCAYLFANRFMLSVTLAWFHVITTLVPLAILLIITVTQDFSVTPPGRYYSFHEFEEKTPVNWNNIYAMLLIIILLSQIVPLINLIAGLIKKTFVKRHTQG